jgi:hypothetical protein
MRPETRTLIFDLTIGEVEAALNLSARAVTALVEDGLLTVSLPRSRPGGPRGIREPRLGDARFRSDQVARAREASGELARVRDRFPPRTRDYDRATALGALLTHLGR